MAKDCSGVHGELPAGSHRTHVLRPRRARQDHSCARIARISCRTLNTAHLYAMTDDTGILQHAIYSVPNCQEGYTTDDNARALIVATSSEGSRVMRNRESPRETLSPISGVSLVRLSIGNSGDSGNFSVMIGAGLKRSGQKTAMAARYGHWEQCWANRRSRVARGGRKALSRPRCRSGFPSRLLTSPRAWAYSVLGMQAIWTGSLGTGSSRELAICLPTGCWIFMNALTPATWHWFEKSLVVREREIVAGAHYRGMAKLTTSRMIEVGIRVFEVARGGAAPR